MRDMGPCIMPPDNFYIWAGIKKAGMAEKTLVIVKPDGVTRGLVGQIIARFEEKGFVIVNLKLFTFSEDQAKRFYAEHRNKHFFGQLTTFITSGPVVAAIVEGANAVAATRLLIGATNASEAAPGSIRGDFGLGFTENIIHASDSHTSFEHEAKVSFE